MHRGSECVKSVEYYCHCSMFTYQLPLTLLITNYLIFEEHLCGQPVKLFNRVDDTTAVDLCCAEPCDGWIVALRLTNGRMNRIYFPSFKVGLTPTCGCSVLKV